MNHPTQGHAAKHVRIPAVFVTGTDTCVGKTTVSAAILAILRAKGLDAVPMKPVQTGCRASRAGLVAPDLEFCLDACGIHPSPAEKTDMAPYRFRPACSPHLAARLAGRAVSIGLVARHFARLTERHDFVVVEGAGGVMVPIGGGKTMLDIMTRLAAPVILVARPGLGAINHCLLSLFTLRQSGLDVLGVVFNHAQPGRPGYIERNNRITVERSGHVPVMGSLPYLPHLDKLTRSPQAFSRWACRNLKIGENFCGEDCIRRDAPRSARRPRRKEQTSSCLSCSSW